MRLNGRGSVSTRRWRPTEIMGRDLTVCWIKGRCAFVHSSANSHAKRVEKGIPKMGCGYDGFVVEGETMGRERVAYTETSTD